MTAAPSKASPHRAAPPLLTDPQPGPAHELVPFLVAWATQYQRECNLDGLHPVHFDLMKKYGARMVDFRRATNAHSVAAIKD